MPEQNATSNSFMKQYELTGKRYSYILPLMILVIGLLLTYWLWHISKLTSDEDSQVHFNSRVRDTIDRTAQRLQVYEEVLRGAQGFFKASINVERGAFRNYVSMLKLADHFPGIQGVGFSLIIPPEEKANHINAIREEGFSEYTIKPEGERDLYTSIIYLEPMVERNLRAFGYDMYSEPVRRAAMESARDTGEARLSGKVLLVQEAKQDIQAGFLIYLPVYRNDVPLATLAQRRENIIGWVYSPFRTKDLIQGIFGNSAFGLDIRLYDGMNPTEATLMYDSAAAPSDSTLSPPRFTTTRLFRIAGHTWTAVISTRPSFDNQLDEGHTTLIAIGGTIISLLLSLIIWTLQYSRQHALEYAKAVNSDLLASEHALREGETKMREILDSTAVAIAWANADGEIKYSNRTFVEMFGYTLKEVPTVESWYQVAYPDPEYRQKIVDKWEANITEAAELGQNISPIELAITCKDGTIRHTILTSAWVGTDILVSFSDVTEYKHAVKELQKSRTILQSILDNLPYLVWMKDESGHFIVTNKAYLASTGKSDVQDVLGKTDADLWPAPLAEKYRREDEEVITEGRQVTLEEQALNDQNIIWTETFKSPVLDEDGSLLGVTGFARDITEKKKEEIRMHHQAHHDELTGLPNRTLFYDRLQQTLSLAKRDQKKMAILFIDLDEFKPVNDTFGHHVGDMVLKEAATRLRACVRESDTVARIGGDEFCILLVSVDYDEAESGHTVSHVAQKALQALQQPFEIMGKKLRITASIGIAIYPNDGEDAQTLNKNADTAMYLAKRDRDNNIRFFTN